MAKKIEQKKPPEEDANDLEILHPECTFTIQGESVTVREYGFVEGLRLRPVAAPLLESLGQMIKSGQELSLESIMDILAEHYETTLHLVAISIDRDVAWLDTLSEHEGDLLLYAWWGACGPFLMRSVTKRRMAEMVAARVRHNPAPAGATSTPPSSPTDTTRTGSAATQSAS